MIALAVQYTRTLIAFMRWRVALALALSLAVSLFEGVGVLLVIPLLQLVGVGGRQGAVGGAVNLVSSAFALFGLRPTLPSVLLVFIAVNVLQALAARWQQLSGFALQAGFASGLRRRLYGAISRADWLFFSRSRSSDFVHALTSDIDRASTAVPNLLLLTTNCVVALVYLGLAVRLSAILTAMVLGCGLALQLAVRGRARASRGAGAAMSSATQDLYAAAIEHMGAMKTARMLNAEERHTSLFSERAARVADMQNRSIRGPTDTTLILEIGSVVLLSLALYVGVKVLILPTAGILLLLFLFARLVPRLSGIQHLIQFIATVLPSFTNVMTLLTRCDEAALPGPDRTARVDLHHEICVDHVSLRYDRDEGEASAVVDVHMVIPLGETVAVIGPSGAGKSTLADLVSGLLVPDAGAVRIDGVPLRPETAGAWRDHIGYVGQDTFLLHDTIRANLLWARPDASDHDIQDALRRAAADEFVAGLPHGLDTVVGDRGVLLSGGERQRLALARALLRRPSLLILDEATSAVDSENERRIQDATDAMHGRVTMLVIAHRLSTVRGADCIYVLEHGRIVEAGTWSELMARPLGRFAAMCRAQGIDPTVHDVRDTSRR